MSLKLRLLNCIVFGLILFSSVYADDVCVKTGPCTCEFSNGTGIDLTPLSKATFYTAQNTYSENISPAQFKLTTYFYHPCYDTLLKINGTDSGTCSGPLSLCRHVTTLSLVNTTTDTYKIDTGVYDFLGSSNYSSFSTDGSSIIYVNGASQTTVILVCANIDEELHMFSLENPKNIVLSFYSRYACLKQIDELGRSLGSTLLIIFFSLVIFYLVLGICTKKFLMGATGVEIIPNLGFWSDLPNLVKDGWAFVLNGFKLPARSAGPVTSPDPNSYDSI